MDANKSLTLKSKNKTRRENTKEERKKQLRKWKKRKLERRKAKRELPAAVAEGPVANVQPAKPKDHEVETNIADTTAKDEKANASPEIHKKQFKALTSSRGPLLVQMARGNAVNPSMFTAKAPLRRSTESLEQDNLQNDKQRVPCKQFRVRTLFWTKNSRTFQGLFKDFSRTYFPFFKDSTYCKIKGCSASHSSDCAELTDR